MDRRIEQAVAPMPREALTNPDLALHGLSVAAVRYAEVERERRKLHLIVRGRAAVARRAGVPIAVVAERAAAVAAKRASGGRE